MKKQIQSNKKTSREVFAFSFNVMLALLEVLAIIFLFTIPIQRYNPQPEVVDWRTFKFFTTDSNVILLIACITTAICIGLKWNGKIKQLPICEYIIKEIAVASVALTMIITLFVLLPGTLSGKSTFPAKSLYMGSNLFMHLICPLVAVVMFLLFENRKDINLKYTCFCLIPVVIYCIFYVSVAYTHIDPTTGKPIVPTYDWYKFCQFGPAVTPFLCIGVMGVYYLFVWLLWLGNRKINIKSL